MWSTERIDMFRFSHRSFWHFDNLNLLQNFLEIIKVVRIVEMLLSPKIQYGFGLTFPQFTLSLIRVERHLLYGFISSGCDQMNFWRDSPSLSIVVFLHHFFFLFRSILRLPVYETHGSKVRWKYNNINKFSSEINK